MVGSGGGGGEEEGRKEMQEKPRTAIGKRAVGDENVDGRENMSWK
jgi:hypothetical protein